MVDLSYVVASKLIFLQNQNIPFNVLISDSGKRIFLFPQVFSHHYSLQFASLCTLIFHFELKNSMGRRVLRFLHSNSDLNMYQN